MSKICPNCLHPVRTGAHYCGYCGTSLIPTPHNPSPTSHHSGKDAASSIENTTPKGKRVSKGGQIGKSWVKVPITLLVLVILAALAIRFWPQILILLSQALPLLKLS